MAIRRSLMIGQKPTGRLPRGFREVEWLRSTGEQWIDTGILSKPNQRFVIKIRINDLTHNNGNCSIIGGWDANYFAQIVANGNADGWIVQWANVFMQVGQKNTEINVFDCDLVRKTIKINGISYALTAPITSSSTNQSMYLFAANNNGTVIRRTKADLFFGEIYNDDILSRNFVTCYRESDNEPGLYDLCGSICPLTNSPFYVNAGTGEFLVGPEVN